MKILWSALLHRATIKSETPVLMSLHLNISYGVYELLSSDKQRMERLYLIFMCILNYFLHLLMHVNVSGRSVLLFSRLID